MEAYKLFGRGRQGRGGGGVALYLREQNVWLMMMWWRASG